MTHVLHLTAWHPYIDGVAGVFVLEQCAALKTAGLDVGLIFSRVEGLRALTAARFLRGLPGFVRLDDPVPTLGFKSWNLPGAAGLVPRVTARMLRNRYAAYVRCYGVPDVLHAHVALEAGPTARAIALRTGTDYVVTEHSSEILNGVASASRRELAAAVYRDARSVIAVSSVLAERILDICPAARVRVVGNLVRDQVFAMARPRDDEDECIRIVSIGALVGGKRLHHAIAALANLPPAIRERIVHTIVGDGPDRMMLEDAARSGGVRTTFPGNQPHARAMAMLADADLLLHPSAFETFGIVLAEAMALGVPVVATRCGGPEGIVTDDTGRLVAVDDVPALTAAIAGVVGDIAIWRQRRQAIACRARTLYHEANIALAIARSYP